jgi:hypothetical protein
VFGLNRTSTQHRSIVPIDGLGELDALELLWNDDLESERDLDADQFVRVLEPA